MNTAQLINAGRALGNCAEELELAIGTYGDKVSADKREKWAAIAKIMFNGEQAIHQAMKRHDDLAAYIYNEKKNIDYNRNLVESVLGIK